MPTVVIFQKIDERTLYQKKKGESLKKKKSNLGQMGKMGRSGKKSTQKDWDEGEWTNSTRMFGEASRMLISLCIPKIIHNIQT